MVLPLLELPDDLVLVVLGRMYSSNLLKMVSQCNKRLNALLGKKLAKLAGAHVIGLSAQVAAPKLLRWAGVRQTFPHASPANAGTLEIAMRRDLQGVLGRPPISATGHKSWLHAIRESYPRVVKFRTEACDLILAWHKWKDEVSELGLLYPEDERERTQSALDEGIDVANTVLRALTVYDAFYGNYGAMVSEATWRNYIVEEAQTNAVLQAFVAEEA